MKTRLTLTEQKQIKTKTVKWNKLRCGSKVLCKGKIRMVTIVDKPTIHNSFPKITFEDGSCIMPQYLTYFKRISY